MRPIYFPYTYISNEVAEAVAACFGRFSVYQPLSDRLPLSMQPWVDKGIIDIRHPVKGDDSKLVSAAENYMDWANLNLGSSRINPVSLKTFKASAPLLDPSLSSQIVAEVKQQANSSATDKQPDPVLASRILLYFAQEFDQQNQELDHVLQKFRQKEEDLIQELKMEEDALADEFKKEAGHMPDLATDYLITGRLEAWTRIFLKDSQPPELFVTHSMAAVEHLLDNAPSTEKISEFKAIPQQAENYAQPAPWQNELLSYLSDITNNKWNSAYYEIVPEIDFPTAENTVSLTIFGVPNQSAPQFFCSSTGIKASECDPSRTAVQGRNTLLCLVES